MEISAACRKACKIFCQLVDKPVRLRESVLFRQLIHNHETSLVIIRLQPAPILHTLGVHIWFEYAMYGMSRGAQNV